MSEEVIKEGWSGTHVKLQLQNSNNHGQVYKGCGLAECLWEMKGNSTDMHGKEWANDYRQTKGTTDLIVMCICGQAPQTTLF